MLDGVTKRNLETGRYNAQHLPRTPSVRDKDIVAVLREKRKAKETQIEEEKVKQGKSEMVGDIIKSCDLIKHKGKRTLHAVEYQYNLDKMVARKYQNITNVIKDLDYAQPDKLEVLYNYKRLETQQEREEASVITKEYRSGIMDPSRETAKLEIRQIKNHMNKGGGAKAEKQQTKESKEDGGGGGGAAGGQR